MRYQNLNLQPGDRIVVPKSGVRLVQHHAIYLGTNCQGQNLIAENKIGHGVILVTADDFFKDVIEITRIEKFPGTNNEMKLAVQKALLKTGQTYDLIDYNCESFVNEIQYGKIESKQVKNLLDGLKVVAVALLFLTAINSIFND